MMKFVVYSEGSKFQKWFDNWSAAEQFAVKSVKSGQYDWLGIGDNCASYGWVDHEGYHDQEDW